MAKRKFTGTDADLLRMKREEDKSVRTIGAEVGLGKSVVAARIARAEAAEQRASTQAAPERLGEAAAAQPGSEQTPPEASSSARSSRSGAVAGNPTDDPHTTPINLIERLEWEVLNSKDGRSRVAAIKELRALREDAGLCPSCGRPAADVSHPRGVITIYPLPKDAR